MLRPTTEVTTITSSAAIRTMAEMRIPPFFNKVCCMILSFLPPVAAGSAQTVRAGPAYRRERKSLTLLSKRKVSRMPAIWPRSLSMG